MSRTHWAEPLFFAGALPAGRGPVKGGDRREPSAAPP